MFFFERFKSTSVVQVPYPLHRFEFGPPKFFSKSFRFSIIFYSSYQISGGGQWRKACRSREKETIQSEITWKQSEPVRNISKIEKRRECVRALWYEQCPKISFKRLYTFKGLLVLVEKASFSKKIRSEFHSGREGLLHHEGTIPHKRSKILNIVHRLGTKSIEVKICSIYRM